MLFAEQIASVNGDQQAGRRIGVRGRDQIQHLLEIHRQQDRRHRNKNGKQPRHLHELFVVRRRIDIAGVNIVGQIHRHGLHGTIRGSENRCRNKSCEHRRCPDGKPRQQNTDGVLTRGELRLDGAAGKGDNNDPNLQGHNDNGAQPQHLPRALRAVCGTDTLNGHLVRHHARRRRNEPQERCR